MIRFYDLAGARDDCRFSPNCWPVRMALLHKGLPFEAIPWRFTEKQSIAFSGQGLVPVLVDGDHTCSTNGKSPNIWRKLIPTGHHCLAAREVRHSRISLPIGRHRWSLAIRYD